MDTRLILLRDNSLARPRTFKKGRMVCYPQRGVRAEELESLFADRRIVFLHRDLQEASVLRRASEPPEVSRTKARVKEFLKNAFGVVVYQQVNHVIDKILLPMFKSGEIGRYSRREVIAFTDFIRRSLPRYAQLVGDEDGRAGDRKRRCDPARARCETASGDGRLLAPRA